MKRTFFSLVPLNIIQKLTLKEIPVANTKLKLFKCNCRINVECSHHFSHDKRAGSVRNPRESSAGKLSSMELNGWRETIDVCGAITVYPSYLIQNICIFVHHAEEWILINYCITLKSPTLSKPGERKGNGGWSRVNNSTEKSNQREV